VSPSVSESISSKLAPGLLVDYFSKIKMEAVRSSETSVNF
jgi:hypothetical protein